MTDEIGHGGGDMSEADWEALAMETLAELDWEPVPGTAIAPGTGERESWSELVLPHRLREAIARINPRLPDAVVAEATQRVLTASSRDAFAENHRLHTLLTKGIKLTYTDANGVEHTPTVWIVDLQNPDNNDYLVANQVTVTDGEHRRRLDVVCFLNGLPVGVIELKKAGDPSADLKAARNQLGAYVESYPWRSPAMSCASPPTGSPPGTALPSPRTSISRHGMWTTTAARWPSRHRVMKTWRSTSCCTGSSPGTGS